MNRRVKGGADRSSQSGNGEAVARSSRSIRAVIEDVMSAQPDGREGKVLLYRRNLA